MYATGRQYDMKIAGRDGRVVAKQESKLEAAQYGYLSEKRLMIVILLGKALARSSRGGMQ